MRGKSQFRGVSWCEKVKKWRALLWDGQKQRFLGHFSTDTEAARAYDRSLLELKGIEAKTNFPATDYESAPPVADDGKRPAPSSIYKGVCFNKVSNKWESRMKQGTRNVYLGMFDNEQEAARAYDLAVLATKGAAAGTNFPPEVYSEEERADAAARLNLAGVPEDGGMHMGNVVAPAYYFQVMPSVPAVHLDEAELFGSNIKLPWMQKLQPRHHLPGSSDTCRSDSFASDAGALKSAQLLAYKGAVNQSRWASAMALDAAQNRDQQLGPAQASSPLQRSPHAGPAYQVSHAESMQQPATSSPQQDEDACSEIGPDLWTSVPGGSNANLEALGRQGRALQAGSLQLSEDEGEGVQAPEDEEAAAAALLEMMMPR